MNGRLREEAAALALAWRFLTRVPLPLAGSATPAHMAAALRYLPAVGAAIGVAGAAVLLGAAQVLPATPTVLLSIAATCVVTGALHEDGLADTLDGIGGGADAERTLEIMRDSRIGAYGALGLGLTLALKAAALVAMPLGVAAAALVAGHAASRLSCVVVISTSCYVRPVGTGGFTAGGPGAWGLAVATITGCLCLAAVIPSGGVGATLAGAGGLVAGHLIACGLFERRLGGYTGDCLGATQQLSEVGLYLGVLAWL